MYRWLLAVGAADRGSRAAVQLDASLLSQTISHELPSQHAKIGCNIDLSQLVTPASCVI